MTDMRKIDFTCPECGNKKLYAERHEIIFHSLYDEIDLEDELHMSGDIACNEDELLDDSVIVSVVCSNCGYAVVPEDWFEKYNDPAELLIDWLEKHNMLPEVTSYN